MSTYKHTKIRMMITAVLYIVFSFSTMSVVVFAWFTIRNDNNASLISTITELDATYELYMFQNPNYTGNQVLDFKNQLCLIDQENCYKQLDETQSFFSIDQSLSPGMRFSFVLKVTPLTLDQGYLSLAIEGVESSGYLTEINKIQTAFFYEVTKVSYAAELEETLDMKENYPIVYYQNYFHQDDSIIYPLLKHVPLFNLMGASSNLYIYFDFYFDPSITGFDALLNPYPNSNVFMNQEIKIKHLLISISKS